MKMKITAFTSAGTEHLAFRPISLPIFLVLFPEIIKLAGAQSGGQGPPTDQPYATFTPSLAIIVSVLIAALIFMLFFSIYARNCGDTSTREIAVRGLSLRNRRAAARGLDASVIETFPTFSYSEVKDHHIGYKGALECAVCLNEFEDDETLRLIPKCDHVFHPECIDAWLESHVTCPVCRADLVPKPGDEPVQFPTPVLNTTGNFNDTMERDNSRNEEVIIQVEANESNRARIIDRNMSFEYTNRPQRSGSVKMFGFDKFRSRSAGHWLVHSGQNLDRFTLRLPAQVRKEMMNRTGSRASTLPREGSSRSGYGGEGSGRAGRSYRRVDPEAKSDRWVSFRRGLSMKSPKNVAEIGQGSSHGGSSSSREPVKMPSFRCLKPKAAEKTGLIMEDQLA